MIRNDAFCVPKVLIFFAYPVERLLDSLNREILVSRPGQVTDLIRTKEPFFIRRVNIA
jgi:hypothetical protein